DPGGNRHHSVRLLRERQVDPMGTRDLHQTRRVVRVDLNELVPDGAAGATGIDVRHEGLYAEVAGTTDDVRLPLASTEAKGLHRGESIDTASDSSSMEVGGGRARGDPATLGPMPRFDPTNHARAST